MRVIGQNRQLPALPGSCIDAHSLKDNGEQAGGDLLAGGDYRVVLARVVQHGTIARDAIGQGNVVRPQYL